MTENFECIAQVSVDKSNQKRKTVEFCFTTRHQIGPLILGQSGHIYQLTLSYENLGPGLFGRAHAGLLEPFLQELGLLLQTTSWLA